MLFTAVLTIINFRDIIIFLLYVLYHFVVRVVRDPDYIIDRAQIRLPAGTSGCVMSIYVCFSAIGCLLNVFENIYAFLCIDIVGYRQWAIFSGRFIIYLVLFYISK